ncbi:hypothetical protein ACTMU2_07245 [Cupriavidus basilensis]
MIKNELEKNLRDVQICFMVGLASAFSAGFWSFVGAGLCRIAFGLTENESMLLIGLPLFVVLLLVFAKHLPKAMRKRAC